MLNLFYLLEATASSGSDSSTSSGTNWTSLVMWIIIIGIFVLMFVFSGRQRKKQEKEMNDRMSSLKIGDKIETIGRIYGTIVEIDDEENTVVLLTGSDEFPGYVKVDKMAVYRTINDVVPVLETQSEELNGDEMPDAENTAEPFEDETLTADDAIEIMSEDDEAEDKKDEE